MLFSVKIPCVGGLRTSQTKLGNINLPKLLIFLVAAVVQLVCPVITLEESFCAGTGYHNVYKPRIPSLGYRSTGWDRFHPVNAPWASYFWTVPSRNDTDDWKSKPVLNVSLVEFRKGNVNYTLSGWLHVTIARVPDSPYQFAAIWAVNQRNEPYGSFVHLEEKYIIHSCNKDTSVYNEPYAYVPCSAGTSNADTVSNMFMYGELQRGLSGPFNKDSIMEATVKSAMGARYGQNSLSVLWRSPAQTYCNRPSLIRFLFAVTPKNGWDSYYLNWNNAKYPTDMWKGRDTGPYLYASDIYYPSFYGHPSNYDPHDLSLMNLRCGNELKSPEDWVVGFYKTGSLYEYWYSPEPWPPQSPNSATPIDKDGNFAALEPKQRSTCKGRRPTDNLIEGFGGRCTSHVDPQYLTYYMADLKTGLKCMDSSVQTGSANFTKDYEVHLKNLKTKLQSHCECRIETNQMISLRMLMRPPPLPWHSGVSRSVKLRKTKYTGEFHRDNVLCSTTKLNLSTKAINDKGGICVQTPVGKLVYGVRQWHGVTSLCVTLMITPISIFVARYCKGEMVLLEGRVQIRSWYLTHIVLVFPTVWMYASGMATISRQLDVLGYSLSYAASFHRTAGIFTMSLIPFLIVTGFIRPINVKARNVFIFLHWFVGIFYHCLELLLCCFTFLIPASPTTKSSVFSRHYGNFFRSSRVSALILGWVAFSCFFNVLLTIRIWRHDRKMGNQGRSVFPIIIPLLIRDEGRKEFLDAEHSHELWFERGALLIFGLVSSIIFAVCVVSLYQALHERLYYGFGPMTCTHSQFGEFISDNHTDAGKNTCHSI